MCVRLIIFQCLAGFGTVGGSRKAICTLPRKNIADPKTLTDPDVCFQMVETLSKTPVIPWEVEVSSHRHLVNCQVSEVIAEFAPPRGTVPRPEWMSPQTKALADCRTQYRRASNRLKKGLKWIVRRCVFRIWRFRKASKACVQYLDSPLNSHELRSTWLMFCSDRIQLQLTKAVAEDKNKEIDRIIKAVDGAFNSKDSQGAFSGLKTLKPYEPRTPQFMKLENGAQAESPKEVRERGVRHWRDLMGGVVCWFSQLVRVEQDMMKPAKQFKEDVRGIPIASDVQKEMFRSKPGKASDENGVPNVCVKVYACIYTNMLYPLYRKCAGTCREPAQAKGANYHELRKPKVGLDQGTQAFHGIGIRDGDVRVLHRVEVREFQEDYEKQVGSDTHGGVRKRGIDFASHTLSTLMRNARNATKNHAVLFLAIISAFDAMDRDLTLFNKDSALNTTVGEGRLQSMLKDGFDGAWATIQGIDEVVATGSGSRPGGPWADKAFGIQAIKILRRISGELTGADLKALQALR